MNVKIALAGAGAFGEKHLDALKRIDGVEVVSVVGRRLEPTQAVAAKYFGDDQMTLATLLPQPLDPNRKPREAGPSAAGDLH